MTELKMNDDISFTKHSFQDYLWVRLHTRGSFLNSTQLKSMVETYLQGGGQSVVLDLEICQGVDSTFMGTLVGLSNACIEAGGTLQITSPTTRTREAMESLGLDMIIDIDPEGASWLAEIATIRATLESHVQSNAPQTVETISDRERTHYVLHAHQALCELNDQNKETFDYVCEALQQELDKKPEDNSQK